MNGLGRICTYTQWNNKEQKKNAFHTDIDGNRNTHTKPNMSKREKQILCETPTL